METECTVVTPSGERSNALRRVSWGSIFAGVVVAMVIMLSLGLLGTGIGLGVVNPTEQNAFSGVGIGAGIWFGISTLIALFFGGWVAGKLAGYPRRSIGTLHGVVVWGLAGVFSFFIMTTTAGMLLGGVAGALGQGISAIATAPAGSQAAMTAQMAKKQMQDAGVSPESLAGKAQQNQGTISEKSENVMNALSKAAIWVFVALILGGIAAAIGGMLGTPSRVEDITVARGI
jgi:hypothetical protein